MARDPLEFLISEPRSVRIRADGLGRLVVLEYDLVHAASGEAQTFRFLVSPDVAVSILQQLGDLQALQETLSAQTAKPAKLQ